MTIAILKRKMDRGGYKQYELQKTVTTVGRSSSCDVVVNDTSLSRLHLRLENRNGRFFLIDNNSSNGTYLNRRKITESLLKDGDSFMTGRIYFVFAQESENMGEKTQPLSLVDAPPVSSTVSVALDDLPSGGSIDFPPFKNPRIPPPPGGGGNEPGLAESAKDTVPRPRAPISSQNQAPGFGPPGATVEVPMSGMVASPVRRLLALVLDAGVGVALSIPSIIMGFLGFGILATILSLLGGLIALAHWLVGWFKFGKTLGKHLMGIKIIDDTQPDNPGLGPKVLTIRIICFFLCALPFGLPFLAILADREGRGIHDKIAGTRVVAS